MTVRVDVRRALLLFTALSLAWLVVAAGLGRFFLQRVERGDQGAIDAVLGWQPGHPAALLRKASTLMEGDPGAAVPLLAQAYRANAADPHALIALAQRLGQEGQWERSDALIALVARLAPADPRVQLEIARHWAVRERGDLVLQHWSTALEVDGALQATLFPALLQMADVPELRQLFTPFAQSPPNWWNGFFRYLCAKASDLETVRYFYGVRRKASHAPLTAEERGAYVARLQRDGMIAEAYVVWIGGLDNRAREKLGLLFDGGFDLPLKYPGFGWQAEENRHFAATPARTQGMVGPAALRLRFRAFEGYFNLLSQPLFLDPGVYRLTGRARPDGLASKGGLRWQVRCLLPAATVLGDAPRFVGSADWTQFDLRFEVPDACLYQQLVLVSAAERSFEYPLEGTLWLDDMKLVRVVDVDAAARANVLLRR